MGEFERLKEQYRGLVALAEAHGARMENARQRLEQVAAAAAKEDELSPEVRAIMQDMVNAQGEIKSVVIQAMGLLREMHHTYGADVSNLLETLDRQLQALDHR